MLGAIIGDIVGSRWEFNSTNDYNFEWLSDENGFTDDTICTVAVADAILHNSEDFGKYIHEWCRKYPHPMGGYGGRFAQWVRSDNPQPYNSWGNGSAMRVSPVAWAAIDLEFKYLLDVAEKSRKQFRCGFVDQKHFISELDKSVLYPARRSGFAAARSTCQSNFQ